MLPERCWNITVEYWQDNGVDGLYAFDDMELANRVDVSELRSGDVVLVDINDSYDGAEKMLTSAGFTIKDHQCCMYGHTIVLA